MKHRRLLLLTVALGLAGAAGCAISSYRRELARARAATIRGSHVIGTDAGLVEYAESGAGVPLLSIHGAGGGFDQGLTNAADIVGGGFRVIAPSRFGYLQTPVPGLSSPSAQADAHAALLRALGIPRAVVLSVSAGARSALQLALRHPDIVEVLVLIVPGTFAPGNPVSVDTAGGSKLAFWLVNAGADFGWWMAEKLVPSMLVRFLGVPPRMMAGASHRDRDRVRRIVRGVQPLSLRFAGINVDSTPDGGELPLQNIAAPTLIISARDDLFNTAPAAEFAANKIGGAKLVLFDQGGHLLIGHGKEVQALVRAFINETVRPGSMTVELTGP